MAAYDNIPGLNDYVLVTGYSEYEIGLDYPHQIRRVSTGRIVKESIDNDGYLRLSLIDDDGKRKTVSKHRIVAQNFVYNDDPVRNTEVDHINKNRTDNHISNLRWASRSTNNRNRTGNKGVNYSFVEYIPDDSVRIHAFRQHTLRDEIYYSLSTNQFYLRVAEYAYRIMHQNVRGRKTFALARSTESKQVRLYNDEVAANIDVYTPIDADEADEEDL